MCLYYDKMYTAHQKRPPLKALVLLTDLKVDDLPSLLSKRSNVSKAYFVNVVPLGNALYRVTLQRTIGLRQIKNEVIIDAGCNGAWMVLTDADSYFATHVLETFFDKMYPSISKLFLNYSQMRSLLKIIRNSCKGTTKLTFFTIKRVKTKIVEDNVFSKTEGTEILWDENVDEEIKRLLSDGFVVKVDRLDFELRDESDAVILKAQMSRKGLAKLKYGSFSAFHQLVLLNSIEYGLGQENFFGKRERKVERGVINLRPLQINYEYRFRLEQLNRFAKKITASYSCSVIHGGNPYFVADLCDYEDGSSFGVTILGNSITVTPVTRATPAAVWRIVDEIQEIMGDGEVTDVTPR
jgi:hypothetical protein